MRVCGVAVAMLPGQSWVISLVDRLSGARGNRPRLPSPPAGLAVGGQVRCRPWTVGRRPRSSPSAREARTWRRGPASRQ